MTYEEAIKIIINQDREIEAITMLLSRLDSKKDKLIKENSEMSFCLRAIKKINQGKNEAIDALCEKDDLK